MEIVLYNPYWLVVLVALFGYISVKYPLWAARAIAFLLPAYLIRIRAIDMFPTNVLELFIFVFGAVLIYKLGSEELQKRIPSKQILYGLAMFVAGAVVATGFALTKEAVFTNGISESILGAIKGFVLIPVLFVLVVSATKIIWEGRLKILNAYIASAAVVAFIALVSVFFFDSSITFDGRLRGFYLSPNHLAMYIMPAIAILFALGLKKRIWIAAFIILTSALIWTQSVGAIGGLIFAVAVLYVLRSSNRGQEKKVLKILPLVLIVGGLIFAVFAGNFADRAIKEGSRSSFASRMMIWKSGTEIIGEHWAMGIGPGAFQEYYLSLQEKFPPYLEWAVPTPHNAGMALWLSTGLSGLMGIIVMLWPVKTREWMPIQIATSVALVAMLLHGFVDTPLLKNDLSVLFLLLMALL